MIRSKNYLLSNKCPIKDFEVEYLIKLWVVEGVLVFHPSIHFLSIFVRNRKSAVFYIGYNEYMLYAHKHHNCSHSVVI